MKKKVLISVLTMALMGGLLAGCGASTDTKAPTSTQPDVEADVEISVEEESQKVEVLSADEEKKGETPVTQTTGSKVSISEMEAYNNNGVVITFTDMQDAVMETDFNIKVDNTSERNILVTVKDVAINGYMMDAAGCYAEVAAGKSANDSIYVWDSELKEAGIDTIARVEMTLLVQDGDSWDIIEALPIGFWTSAGEEYEQVIDDSGDLVYEASGVKVICKGLKEDSIWDGSLVFYLENNTDQAVSVYTENVSVNGVMEDETFWTNILPDHRSISSMTLIDLSDQNITSIDEITDIEYVIHIIDEDTWSDIAVSDPIILNFD